MNPRPPARAHSKSALVVDASVAVQWFIPEDGSALALALLDGAHRLIAPGLLWTEVASVLWKHARKKALTDAEALAMLTDAMVFPVEVHDSQPLLGSALRLALDHDRTVYDCLYVALAVRERATLVTADARLARSLEGTPAGKSVALLSAFG